MWVFGYVIGGDAGDELTSVTVASLPTGGIHCTVKYGSRVCLHCCPLGHNWSVHNWIWNRVTLFHYPITGSELAS